MVALSAPSAARVGPAATASPTAVGRVVQDLAARGKARHVGTVTTVPADVPVVSVDELKRLFDPLLKRPIVWVVAGVAVAGGGYFLFRRRRRS